MIPDNIALFLDEANPGRKQALAKALASPEDTESNLIALGSSGWKIRVMFKEPQCISLNRWRSKEVKEYIFAGFFLSRCGTFCYATRRSEHGRLFGFRVGFGFLDNILRYNLVDRSIRNFSNYAQFARRFDRRFITQTEIQRLWNSTSSQHGERYRPSDFHHIGSKGREVVRKFVERFAGIDATSPTVFYDKVCSVSGRNSHYLLTVYERAWRKSGRDITINHALGRPQVEYSSEYPGCGNGRYGILATSRTFLWLEDD